MSIKKRFFTVCVANTYEEPISRICYPKLKYSKVYFLNDTDAILNILGNTVFRIKGSWNRPETLPSFMGLIKCFDDRRSVRLW
jgi:hypothetical protein